MPLSDTELINASRVAYRSRAFLKCWRMFSDPKILNDRRDALVDYGDFWALCEEAMRMSFIVFIATLYDTRADTLSLKGAVENQPDLKSKFQEANAIAGRLKKIRHKVYAHRSVDTSVDDAFELASVSFDQLFELSQLTIEIVDCLLECRDLEPPETHPYARSSLEELLETLQLDWDQSKP